MANAASCWSSKRVLRVESTIFGVRRRDRMLGKIRLMIAFVLAATSYVLAFLIARHRLTPLRQNEATLKANVLENIRPRAQIKSEQVRVITCGCKRPDPVRSGAIVMSSGLR